MSEEIKKEAPPAENKPEETKKLAPSTTDKPVEKTEAKPADKPAAMEKAQAKNCVQCNKPIKKKTGYYRNGKYYCNKRCFKLSKKATAPLAA